MEVHENQVTKTFLVRLSKAVFFSLFRLLTRLIQVKIFSDPLTLTMKIAVHNVFMITMICLYNLVVCIFQEVDGERLTLKRKGEHRRKSFIAFADRKIKIKITASLSIFHNHCVTA